MIVLSLIFLLSNCNAIYDSSFSDYTVLMSNYAFDWIGDNSLYPTCYDLNDKELQHTYQSNDSDISIFIIDNNLDHAVMLSNEFDKDIHNSHLKIDYENHHALVMTGGDEVQNLGLGAGMEMMYMQVWNNDEVKQYFSCISEKKLVRNYNGHDLPLPSKFPNACNTKASADNPDSVSNDGKYTDNPYYTPDPNKADVIIVEIFYDEEESKANFYAQNIEIPAGKMVAWLNEDSTGAMHSIKSADENEKYESDELGKYDLFSHRFNNKGEFAYYCTFHPWMKGVITVK